MVVRRAEIDEGGHEFLQCSIMCERGGEKGNNLTASLRNEKMGRWTMSGRWFGWYYG